jgi:hypothetical protein
VHRRILAQFSTSARAEVAALLGGDKKVINSGVILATPAAMLLHVDALVDEMWALGGRYDRWMVGVDQAAHMLLVYRNRTRQGGAKGKRKRGRREPRFEIATLLPRAIGSVLHVSDVNPSDYKIDERGVVRTTAADGAAYTMGHRNWPPLELGTPHPPAKSADPVFASLLLLSQSGTERHMPCRMASAGHGQATESACRYERRKAVHGHPQQQGHSQGHPQHSAGIRPHSKDAVSLTTEAKEAGQEVAITPLRSCDDDLMMLGGQNSAERGGDDRDD